MSEQVEEETLVTETVAPVDTSLTGDTAYPFIRVVDGDTIVAGVNGTSEFVRIIGIDSPEPNDPGGPECYATEATEHLKELARTGTIVLVPDQTQGSRDKYGRLLAYVELPDGTDLGEAMVRDGYAREFTYDRPYDRRGTYVAAEKEAIVTEAGLWSADTCITEE
jgi:micrococcal nuclease